MRDEIKKDEQAPEVKTQPSGESLPVSELDKVVGGEAVTFNYGKIEWTYTKQENDGTDKK